MKYDKQMVEIDNHRLTTKSIFNKISNSTQKSCNEHIIFNMQLKILIIDGDTIIVPFKSKITPIWVIIITAFK